MFPTRYSASYEAIWWLVLGLLAAMITLLLSSTPAWG